jgi:hypothetical protein
MLFKTQRFRGWILPSHSAEPTNLDPVDRASQQLEFVLRPASVDQFVLVSSSPLGPMTTYYIFLLTHSLIVYTDDSLAYPHHNLIDTSTSIICPPARPTASTLVIELRKRLTHKCWYGYFLFRYVNLVGLEIWENGRRDPSRWPHGILYPQKLGPTSLTSGGRLV